jgi:hypothetical protein
MAQGHAFKEFFGGQRIGIGEIFARYALEVGDDDAHDASGLEHLPAVSGECEGFGVRELGERVGQVDKLHAVVEKWKSLADIVTLNILGPGWRF